YIQSNYIKAKANENLSNVYDQYASRYEGKECVIILLENCRLDILPASLHFFFSSRRRHTRCYRDWSSDVCSSDLGRGRARACGSAPSGRGRGPQAWGSWGSPVAPAPTTARARAR